MMTSKKALMKTMMKTFGIAMMLAVVLIISASCANLRSGDRNVSYYSLEYEPPLIESAEPLPVVIRIERFRVFPLYDSTKMIYREKAYKREAYVFHKWWANPSDLTSYFLARDLRQSGRFGAVFSPDQSILATHVIEGMVEDFYEQDDDNSWKAVLSLNISLIKENEPDVSKRILMQRKYSITEPCEEKTPRSMAQAMSRAMSKLSARITGDVYLTISSSKP